VLTRENICDIMKIRENEVRNLFSKNFKSKERYKVMEKLYTVEDIAGLASVTTRTIRNYIKDGVLTGRKIGGQWRFTEEDYKKFTVSSSDALLEDWVNEEALDFISGVTDHDGEIQICAVIDLYQPQEVVIEKIKKLSVLEEKNLIRCRSQLIRGKVENESKRRTVLFGSADNVAEAIKILQG